MSGLKKAWLGVVVLAFAGLAAAIALRHSNFAVLNPSGPIASQERHLLFVVILLGLLVIVPVFALLFGFAWRYRETNTKAKYSPELDGNLAAETIWWLIPLAIISVVSVLTWNSSHRLDPYRALDTTKKPLNVQVVALEWKWLFIYPEQHVASVNSLYIPEKTPINFQITADAPMNSFWIPQLGGQVYAMAGMNTQLHLMADKTGDFSGSSANLSGEGFASMRFKAHAKSSDNFTKWVSQTQQTAKPLSLGEYASLSLPTTQNTPTYYSNPSSDLYDTILMKYMMPGAHKMDGGMNMNGMDMSSGGIQ